jgi:outer membrane protein TolC
VNETRGLGLPQVNGSVGLQYSPTLQRFFAQYNSAATGIGISQDDATSLGIQNGDVYAAENFFQLQAAGDASLGINQLIFNGSYIVGLQAANAFKELSSRNSFQTKEQVVYNVSQAYYTLLITKERMDLVTANMKRIDTLYRNTSALKDNGFAEKIDVDRLKVTLNNLKVEESNMKNMLDISRRILKLQMNFPAGDVLTVQGNIADMAIEKVDVPDANAWSYAQRPDYRVMESNKTLQELNIKNKYAEALPSLSAFANLGFSTQSPTFTGLFSTEANFSEVDAAGPDSWYQYSACGLSLNWSLFTGLQRKFQIQQEKLELEKIENGFEAMEQSIDLEVKQSSLDLENATERLAVQKDNMELAGEIYSISKIKYEEGVGSNLEVIEADTSLKEAQTNYYAALYDAIIAQLQLKKALGILYN